MAPLADSAIAMPGKTVSYRPQGRRMPHPFAWAALLATLAAVAACAPAPERTGEAAEAEEGSSSSAAPSGEQQPDRTQQAEQRRPDALQGLPEAEATRARPSLSGQERGSPEARGGIHAARKDLRELGRSANLGQALQELREGLRSEQAEALRTFPGIFGGKDIQDRTAP